jgi:hypothetical protein
LYEYNQELYNAWKHGKNGGSIFGAPVNGAFTAMAFSDGAKEYAASIAAAPSTSYSTPSASGSTYTRFSSGYSGGYGGDGGVGSIGTVSSGASVGGELFGLLFLLAALFGAYDRIENHASIVESAMRGGGAVYGFSDVLGQKVRQISPDSWIIAAVNGTRWVIGTGIAITAGFGAGVGNTTIAVIGEAAYLIKTASTNLSADSSVSHVAVGYSPSAPSISYATITAINLNLRAEPRMDPNNILTTMPQGMRVKVVGHAQNGWLELSDVPGTGDQSGQRFHGFASPKGLAEN